MRTILIALLGVALPAAAALAQQRAPRDKIQTTVGGAVVTLEYGQPALNGRSLDELLQQLPEDRMWRAGSEQVTTFSTKAPIRLGGSRVPAGEYSVYIHCGEENQFRLVLNRVVGQPLGDIWKQAPADWARESWPHFAYTKEIGDEEVVRVPLNKASASVGHERLRFAFSRHDGETLLTMSWGDQSWNVALQPAQ